ncbi:putative spermidine/putrescine transport system permease protein [Stella humosa]|uniref:Putative spermidine/putrescine transport system permease protein n=1 Tax=Stella humosa TaxID=94 RepID=A0A3N1MEP0_9PROT|nr:ABC transporter permease [Stella humosa]ROQ01615.1 putative spermidine/putrescine transport system permease protein [Stella humosa]BBK31996.1 ABC transporter permease [Stella humosa]
MADEARIGAARPTRSLGWAIVLFLVLPITIVVPVSLTDQRFLSLPQDGLSLRHYINLVQSADWLSSVAQSFVIALGSMVISVGAGTLCAIGCWRIGSRWSELIRVLMLVPIIVPTIVYALGLYRLWVQLDLLDSYFGVMLAHGVTGIPYVVIIVSTSLASFDPRLEQAARNLGASVPYTLRRVILPSILPGVISGSIFAFIHSWDELVLVLFIASRAIFTLPRRIWDGINEHLDPTMAAVATALVAVTAILLILDMKVRRQRSE